MKPLQFISRIPDYLGAITSLYIGIAILSIRLLNYPIPWVGKVDILPFIGIVIIAILQILFIPRFGFNWNSIRHIATMVFTHLIIFAIAFWYYSENFGPNSLILLVPSLILSFEFIQKRPKRTFRLFDSDFPTLFKPTIYMLSIIAACLFIIIPIHLFLSMIYSVEWLNKLMAQFWIYAYWVVPAVWYFLSAYQSFKFSKGESSDVDLDSLMDERPKLGS